MQPRAAKLVTSFLLTLVLLILLEIGTSAFLPAIGWYEYRISFNVLIVLYMALKLNGWALPWLVMLLQLVHSVFSIEGWALGTVAGIVITAVVGWLKEVIQFSSALATMAIVQIFQVIWYLATCTVICLKMGNFDKFMLLFGNAVPGTFALSLFSPVLFGLLDRIWRPEEEVSSNGVGML